MTASSQNIEQLRAEMKARRESLSASEQSDLGNLIFEHVIALEAYQDAKTIALYLAVRGEVATNALIQHALTLNKQVFLPVLDPNSREQMFFADYNNDSPLVKNRFGMLEPVFDPNRFIDPQKLDLVLCPLVAFDAKANRIGMGGGFYDRHFAFKNQLAPQAQKPHLIGVAYEFQKVKAIQPEVWDVGMSAIVTESAVYYPRKNC